MGVMFKEYNIVLRLLSKNSVLSKSLILILLSKIFLFKL